jgi:ribonuclease HII
LKNNIAGVDEVGRGALAGPVIAAAVILKNDIEGLKDSKKISEKKRIELSNEIKKNSYFAIGSASHNEIDEINIHNASLLAMKRAILNLPIKPNMILVDGKFKPNLKTQMKAIIGGDSKHSEISAASIIAKVYRDNLMIEYSKKYMKFNLNKNKGYGTRDHLEALKNNKYSVIHRKSFNGVLN